MASGIDSGIAGDSADSAGSASIASARRLLWAVVSVVVAAAIGSGFVLWQRLVREAPQPLWLEQGSDGVRFLYAPLGDRHDASIPYWIFYVLPQVFPEKLAGSGGYARLGLTWERGRELPVGLAKRVAGYPRVEVTCALCHATRWRASVDADAVVVPAGPGNTANALALFQFLVDCASDPRFDADVLLPQITNATKLDLIDQLLYRFWIIPRTRAVLVERGTTSLWRYRPGLPAVGLGSDDPPPRDASVYLSRLPPGASLGSTRMPAAWHLGKYGATSAGAPAQALGLRADTRDARSAVVDSAAGLLDRAPADAKRFEATVDRLARYLEAEAPPRFPFAAPATLDEAKARAGKAVFDVACASCHADDGPRVGRSAPAAEIGTDPVALGQWTRVAAVLANQDARAAGLERAGYVEADPTGYAVPHLDGLWLRGAYLHNGSVPTLWDLLAPADRRPTAFYRGNDVLDPVRVGFVSSGADAERRGVRFDTHRPGNGNRGHEFGTTLDDASKWALIEYLKTL